MSRFKHSKSSLFMMELLINLLLFCLLCGYGLMFFIKSNNITEDTTTMHQAVRITSSIASVYESGDGSYLPLCEEFSYASLENTTLSIYYDATFQPCAKENAVYYVLIEKLESSLNKIKIEFYDTDGDIAHSITACQYTPSTLADVKEEE